MTNLTTPITNDNNVHAYQANNILVVDDYRVNRIKLKGLLKQLGHTVLLAENGIEALEIVKETPVDIILLDIVMPKMDGYTFLSHVKSNTLYRNIPVIIISEIDDIESIVRCIQMGAEDYLPKPFNVMLLKARLNACFEKKQWRHQEQLYLQQLKSEREKSDRLLKNILPNSIAERLKQGESLIADSFAQVTVLFADINQFTQLSAHTSPSCLVKLLNKIFSLFDRLALKYSLEKIKTIGDAYMVVGGLPIPDANSADNIAKMALDMQRLVPQFTRDDNGEPISIRVGIHTGSVVAGIIGESKFSYDLWGDTVNIASRMEMHGLKGAIQVSDSTYKLLQDNYIFTRRGQIEVKGKGMMTTYFLEKPNPNQEDLRCRKQLSS